jgi:membrane protease YdiL (CAAX protease family)
VKSIEKLAGERPIAFGFVATFSFILMLIISAFLGSLWSGEQLYGQPGGILGRAIAILFLLVILSRLGWLHLSGFTSLGQMHTWLIIILPLAYSIFALTYAMTSEFVFKFSTSEFTWLVTLFIVTAAFLEEVVFRGMILYGLVRAWGDTNTGHIRSVVVSSLFFCSIHLLDYLSGRPISSVLLQTLEVFFLGVFLAALVLRGKSIYPASFFHCTLNLLAFSIFGSSGVEPATGAWLILSIFMLPLAILGVYLLHKISHKPDLRDPR